MRTHILHEGETEKKLLRALGAEGKATKFNPYHNDIRKLARLIGGKDSVYLVYDTDIADGPGIDRFLSNISGILKVTKKLTLVQQTENLEDELTFACPGRKFQDICKAFGATPPTADNFKRKFMKSSNCLQTLDGLGFDKNRLFDQTIHPDLEPFSRYKGKPRYKK